MASCAVHSVLFSLYRFVLCIVSFHVYSLFCVRNCLSFSCVFPQVLYRLVLCINFFCVYLLFRFSSYFRIGSCVFSFILFALSSSFVQFRHFIIVSFRVYSRCVLATVRFIVLLSFFIVGCAVSVFCFFRFVPCLFVAGKEACMISFWFHSVLFLIVSFRVYFVRYHLFFLFISYHIIFSCL